MARLSRTHWIVHGLLREIEVEVLLELDRYVLLMCSFDLFKVFFNTFVRSHVKHISPAATRQKIQNCLASAKCKCSSREIKFELKIVCRYVNTLEKI